jgi:hypothetical protein
MIWATSAGLSLASQDQRDISISYFEARSLGVIAGGAAIVVGIIVVATTV